MSELIQPYKHRMYQGPAASGGATGGTSLMYLFYAFITYRLEGCTIEVVSGLSQLYHLDSVRGLVTKPKFL